MTSPHSQQDTVRRLDHTPRSEPIPSAVRIRRRRSGRWLVLRVDGEMDIQAEALVIDAVRHDPTFVVFALKGVTFIDASGLRVLTESHRRAAAAGGDVRVAAPSPCVRRFLALAGSTVTLSVFDTLRTALSTPLGQAGPAS